MARLTPPLTIFFLSIVLASCGGDGAARQPQGAPAVDIALPLVEQVADWDDFTGRFDSPEHVDVRSRVSGYLDTVNFEDGAIVEAGDLLFTIDPRPFEAVLAAANGQLAQARAQLVQARADLDRAERLLSSRAISEEAIEQRRTAVRTAEAGVASANANSDAAALNLEFTQVKAPTAGRTSSRLVDPGNLVSGGNSSGDILTTIVGSDPLYFEFDASEAVYLRYQRRVRTDQVSRVEIRLQDEPDYRHTGEIVFADNRINPASGTIRVRARVANPDGLIRPGMLGSARVGGSAFYEAVLVPQTAILSDGPRRIVYVVNDTDTVETRLVSVGPPSGNLQVISSGLEATDRVIISGLMRARPGAPVTPQLVEIVRQGRDAPAALTQAQPASAAYPADQ
ncbi:efflux RND transporter periplasmic adaptor subunit [uncultured Maricaulis sp.]|uniref:efflux RND transporter periplasmic adaptor subunit n=1 Tax=uncultured Maricaulis sp. TaxID=174710 RepID=UPI0030D734E1|tara:strand:+ start:52168 stop:53355 length:1188 start_codon:yes stop_codon:yes gene_type:complete